MATTRAGFDYYPSSGDTAVFILDGDNGVSVKDDAEAVVAMVLRDHPGKRIFARDTMHRWSELKHNGNRFTERADVSMYESGEILSVTSSLMDSSAQLIDAPRAGVGGQTWLSQWVDENGALRPAEEVCGGDISLNISEGRRWLSLDVDNEVIYRGDTNDGRIVWQDEDGNGYFWLFDPSTGILKQSLNRPADLIDKEGAHAGSKDALAIPLPEEPRLLAKSPRK